MKLKDLSQLYYLNREIENDKRRVDELRQKATGISGGNLEGIPGGGNFESRVERYIAEIVDLEAIISAKMTQCIHEQKRIERYIADIPDSLTRQIFTLRFVDGLLWKDVAAKMGSGNTWKNLSNICYRYIEKVEDNEEYL